MHFCAGKQQIICAVCQMTGIVATVDGTAYTEIAAAVTDWLANGGTLTLHWENEWFTVRILLPQK